MSYYAIIDKNNIVTEVITGVPENELIEGKKPEIWYGAFRGMTCKRTSIDGAYRKNYAGIGYTYDKTRDAFIAPTPFTSWVLNEDTCQWEAPTPMPEDGKDYSWDEDTVSWVEVPTPVIE